MIFIAIAILFFAFTSIVANYTYAENALIYLRGGNTLGLTLLRLAALGMVIWGGYEAVVTVFNAADASMGLMATINSKDESGDDGRAARPPSRSDYLSDHQKDEKNNKKLCQA
mgnify:CR=1 FL=1